MYNNKDISVYRQHNTGRGLVRLDSSSTGTAYTNPRSGMMEPVPLYEELTSHRTSDPDTGQAESSQVGDNTDGSILWAKGPSPSVKFLVGGDRAAPGGATKAKTTSKFGLKPEDGLTGSRCVFQAQRAPPHRDLSLSEEEEEVPERGSRSNTVL